MIFRWSLMIAVGVSVPAAAQRMRVAVQPMAAPGVDDVAMVKELEVETLNLLVGTSNITPVNRDDVATQLAGDGGRCAPPADVRLKCLERLALTTRAEYALGVELKRFGKSYELAAVLVPRNGERLATPAAMALTPPAEGKTAFFKTQLRVLLLERMKLGALPAVPLASPVVQTPPPVLVPPIVVADPDEGQRSLGRRLVYAGAGLTVIGLACAAAGAGFGYGAGRTGNAASNVEAARQASNGKLLTTIGFTAAGVGVVAALLGVTLKGISADAPTVGLVPASGGGSVWLGGSF